MLIYVHIYIYIYTNPSIFHVYYIDGERTNSVNGIYNLVIVRNRAFSLITDCSAAPCVMRQTTSAEPRVLCQQSQSCAVYQVSLQAQYTKTVCLRSVPSQSVSAVSQANQTMMNIKLVRLRCV